MQKKSSCFGWLLESSPPPDGMMGATLEIQRAQHIEALEQQIIQQQIVQVIVLRI